MGFLDKVTCTCTVHSISAQTEKNIGGEIAATSFSAVGLLLLSRWLEQKPGSVQPCHLLILKNGGVEDFNQFLMDIPSF